MRVSRPKVDLPLTPFQAHRQRWGSGCGSEICSRVRHVVLARGKIPCQVLLVGEAPGKVEDLLGSPFVGPAGQLLDAIVERALANYGYSFALTNLVGCIPLEEGGVAKTERPPHDAVLSCQGRLGEFVCLADGSDGTDREYAPTLLLVVAVGDCAASYLDPAYKHSLKLHRPIPILNVVHPAHILRQNIAQRGLLVQRCTASISTRLDELEEVQR